jgi:hypothetical protein
MSRSSINSMPTGTLRPRQRLNQPKPSVSLALSDSLVKEPGTFINNFGSNRLLTCGIPSFWTRTKRTQCKLDFALGSLCPFRPAPAGGTQVIHVPKSC